MPRPPAPSLWDPLAQAPHRATGSAPWHYLLGPLGAVLLGAEDRDDKKWLPQVRAGRQLALERSQRLNHLTGAS